MYCICSFNIRSLKRIWEFFLFNRPFKERSRPLEFVLQQLAEKKRALQDYKRFSDL